MMGLFQDIRYAARGLRKSPGFTAVAVLTLALGIGANTAIFSFAHALLLDELPVRSPEELFWISRTLGENEMAMSDGEIVDISPYHSIHLQRALVEQRAGSPFSYSAAVDDTEAVLMLDDEAVSVVVQVVSGELFEMLGVGAEHGRALRPDDDRAEAETVVVLQHEFWRTRLGADPSVVGGYLRLTGRPVRVVGVAPAGFRGLSTESAPEMWAPISAVERIAPPPRGVDLSSPTHSWVRQVVRLAPHADFEQAHAFASIQVNRARASATADTEPLRAVLLAAGRGDPATVRRWATPMTLLAGSAALVLLIACVNVASLLLVRAADRQREAAVRLALGARPTQLVRQRMVESGLLAALGLAAGCALAWNLRPLALLWAPGMARSSSEIDGAALSFAALLALGVAALCGAAPAWSSFRRASRLSGGGRSEGPESSRLRGFFIAAQVALCLPALVASALLLRSLENLYSVELGLDPSKTVMATLDPVGAGIAPERLPVLYRDVLDRLRAEPDIAFAAIAGSGGLSGSSSFTMIQPDNASEEFSRYTARAAVSEQYFDALKIPLLSGRSFRESDGPDAPFTAIVNRSYAHLAFGDEDVVGRRLRVGRRGPANVEIVGLVGDVKYQRLREEPTPVVYFPYRQRPRERMRLYVYSAGVLPAERLRDLVGGVAPGLPIKGIRSMDEQIANTLRRERMLSTLLTTFGLVGLLLTAVGLFGVTAYAASKRTREMGLRKALGAAGGDLIGLVVSGSLRWAVAGCALGVVAALALGGLLAKTVYGVTTTDPVSIGAAVVLMLLTAAAASYAPARRAARVEPMEALRHE